MDWITMNLGPIFQIMAEVEENSADVEKANVINIAVIDFNSGSSVNYVVIAIGASLSKLLKWLYHYIGLIGPNCYSITQGDRPK